MVNTFLLSISLFPDSNGSLWLNNFCLYCSCRKSFWPKPWMNRQVERVLYIAGFPLESTKERVQCFFFFFCYKYCNYISFFNYFLFELRSLYAIYHPKKKKKTVCIKNLGWFTLSSLVVYFCPFVQPLVCEL